MADQSDSRSLKSSYGPGWGSPRTAARLHVSETHDGLIIETILSGLDANSITVRVMGDYLVIEGRLTEGEGGGRGRYARQVWQLREMDANSLTCTYQPDGQLIVCLRRK